MSERHPIDELFHHALQDAEVTPPPAVWEGIVRERGRRRGGYWGWLVAALVVMGGGAALWVTNGGEPALSSAPHQERSIPSTNGPDGASTTSASTPGATPTREGTRTLATTEGQMTGNDRPASSEAAVPEHLARQAGTDPTPPDTPARTAADAMNGVGASPSPDAASLMPMRSDASPAAPRANEEHLDRLSALTIALPLLPVDRDSVHATTAPLPYVLPNADWWLALEVGRFNEHRTWYGTDEQLVTALNATEVPHYTWCAGVLGGRTWRGGFGFSLGAAYEASSQSFHYSGPTTVQDTMLYIPYLVTLDTQVFVSSVDTIPASTTVLKQTNSTNRFSLVRISTEGYWHTTQRRWTLGPRLGLATEFTTMRQGYTLDAQADSAEVDLVSVPMNEDAYDARYATTLTGMIGADIGFALNEHWGFWATPSYSRGLTTWGDGTVPYMLPERIGLRLRLSYTFTKIP